MKKVLTATLVAAVASMAAPALAAEPFSPTDFVSDPENILEDQQRLDDLLFDVSQEVGGELFIIVVSDFSGASATDWAADAGASAVDSGDGLIAIAVETGDIGYYADTRGAITQTTLDDAIDAGINSLRDGDWDQAIVDMAEDVRSGGSGNGAGSSFKRVLPFLIITIIIVTGGYVMSMNRKKKQRSQLQESDLESLGQRANSALVAADDGVRSASTELGFARAEFGVQATQKFEQIVDRARQEVQYAFEYRAKLDDNIPDTDAQKRQYFEGILKHTSAAQAMIEEQEKEFAELRELNKRIGTVFSELKTRVDELQRQVPNATGILGALSSRYSPKALQTLNSYPEQINELAETTAGIIAKGEAEVAAENRGGAVPFAKIAEENIEQMASMISQVTNASDTLEQARIDLQKAIASLSSDVEDAKRLGGTDQNIARRREEAEAVLAEATDGDPDPLRYLDTLERAEAAIDNALAGVREKEENERRLHQNLERARANAESRIETANSIIDANRQIVGAGARQALSAAMEAKAAAVAATDPNAALAAFEAAKGHASEATRLAQADIDNHARHRNEYANSGNGSFSDMLTGIIIGSVLNGGRGRGYGNYYGGGRSSHRNRSFGGSSRRTSFGGGRRSGGFGGGSRKF